MSIELILAIFFFGLLPLIERAIRAARERQEQPPQGPPPYPSPEDVRASGRPAPREYEPREGMPYGETYEESPYEEAPHEAPPYEAPPYVPPPREAAPYEVPPVPARAQRAATAVANLPKAVRQRASEVPISRATAHDRRTADAFDRPRERRRRRGGRVADLLHTEAGLKRAFVMMTVLGPCRAFSPYDQP